MPITVDYVSLLYAQVLEVEVFPVKTVLYIVGGLFGLVVLFYIGKAIFNRTQYEIDGSYGGGPGLRNFFKHKRLRYIDREGYLRGKARSFQDPELEQLLLDDKLSEAAKYITGILNAAKEAGDKHTKRRYEKYYDEIIKRFDELEESEHGGKAIHVKK